MDKRTQRAQAAAARAGMTAQERAGADERICRRLMALPEVQRAKTVFSYLAMPEEADLTALNQWLLDRGCTLAFPVTGPSWNMEAYAPDLPWRFARDRFGIPAPIPALARRIAPGEIDLILVPCVAFDSACRRLGHGGGFYDRYLPQCPSARFIGAAFETQRLRTVACDALDIPMHAFVTEKKVYRPKK